MSSLLGRAVLYKQAVQRRCALKRFPDRQQQGTGPPASRHTSKRRALPSPATAKPASAGAPGEAGQRAQQQPHAALKQRQQPAAASDEGEAEQGSGIATPATARRRRRHSPPSATMPGRRVVTTPSTPRNSAAGFTVSARPSAGKANSSAMTTPNSAAISSGATSIAQSLLSGAFAHHSGTDQCQHTAEQAPNTADAPPRIRDLQQTAASHVAQAERAQRGQRAELVLEVGLHRC